MSATLVKQLFYFITPWRYSLDYSKPIESSTQYVVSGCEFNKKKMSQWTMINDQLNSVSCVTDALFAGVEKRQI